MTKTELERIGATDDGFKEWIGWNESRLRQEYIDECRLDYRARIESKAV